MAFAIWSYPNQRTFRVARGGLRHHDSLRKLRNQHSFIIKPFNPADGFYSLSIDEVMVLEKSHDWLMNEGLRAKDIGLNDPLPNYESLVSLAVAEMQSEQRFQKVVLSRYDDVEMEAFNFYWLDHLRKAYPTAFISMVSSDELGTWLTASPELFLKRTGDSFLSYSLAGTKYSDDTTLGKKERREQRIVTDFIRATFENHQLNTQVNSGKEQKAGRLTHLLNIVEGLHEGVDMEIDSLCAELHPTPAVGGSPWPWASDFIKFEGYDRSLYTGFLGEWKDVSHFEFYVNLRCAQIFNKDIRFYAGAGVTADSVPEKEYLETEAKMGVLKSVLLSQQ